MKKSAGLVGFVSVFLCMLLMVSACGGGKRTEENPYARMSKADMKYKNVQVVNFTISPRGVQESEPTAILKEAQEACVKTLIESNLFEDVKSVAASTPGASTIIVQGELSRLRIVGGGARFWLGAGAGKSEMAIYVKLIDASTGKVITERDVRDDSNPYAGAWSMGASDRVLPVQVGSQITDLVVNAAKK